MQTRLSPRREIFTLCQPACQKRETVGTLDEQDPESGHARQPVGYSRAMRLTIRALSPPLWLLRTWLGSFHDPTKSRERGFGFCREESVD